MTTAQPDPVRARYEIFLRQAIAHNVGIVRRGGTELAAHADASVNAWWAHRLLLALAEAAPDTLPALLADISAELERGGAHGAAWDAAIAAGIDPEALTAHMEARFAAAPTTRES
jgi:hypothetical protein